MPSQVICKKLKTKSSSWTHVDFRVFFRIIESNLQEIIHSSSRLLSTCYSMKLVILVQGTNTQELQVVSPETKFQYNTQSHHTENKRVTQ